MPSTQAGAGLPAASLPAMATGREDRFYLHHHAQVSLGGGRTDTAMLSPTLLPLKGRWPKSQGCQAVWAATGEGTGRTGRTGLAEPPGLCSLPEVSLLSSARSLPLHLKCGKPNPPQPFPVDLRSFRRSFSEQPQPQALPQPAAIPLTAGPAPALPALPHPRWQPAASASARQARRALGGEITGGEFTGGCPP